MNNKRQTVWLVSMLSLMVVLSAYYLFTEDSSPANPPVADSEQVSKVKQDAAQEATTKAEEQLNELKVNEVVTNGEVTDGASATSTKSDTASTTDPATENSKGDKDTANSPLLLNRRHPIKTQLRLKRTRQHKVTTKQPLQPKPTSRYWIKWQPIKLPNLQQQQ